MSSLARVPYSTSRVMVHNAEDSDPDTVRTAIPATETVSDVEATLYDATGHPDTMADEATIANNFAIVVPCLFDRERDAESHVV